METHINTQYGTQPLVLVRIHWSTGAVWYAESPNACQTDSLASLLTAGHVSTSIRNDVLSEYGNVSLSFDDTDGHFAEKIRALDMSRVHCQVFLCFADMSYTEAQELIDGVINFGDVRWDEGQRELELSVETRYESRNVGHLLESEEGRWINPDAIGKTVPMAWGSVVHVPALHAIKPPRTTVSLGGGSKIKMPASTLPVAGSTGFPQGVPLDLVIGDVKFSGQFDGKTLSILSWNIAYSLTFTFTDESVNPYISYVNAAPTYSLVGKVFTMTMADGTRVSNIVMDQDDRQIKWAVALGATFSTILDSTVTINGVHGTLVEGWPVPMAGGGSTTDHWTRNVTYFLPTWISTLADGYAMDGAIINMDTDDLDTYVANMFPSYAIRGVYAMHKDVDGEDVFRPVYSDYYTKQLSFMLNGISMTAVQLKRLSATERAAFGDDLYISLQSTRGNDLYPILEYLLTEYSSLVPDGTFANNHPLPMNFAIFDQRDCLDLCAELAWQGVCSLQIFASTISVKSLIARPAPRLITADNTEADTVVHGFTDANDVIARIISTWQRNYQKQNDVKITVEYGVGPTSLNKDMFAYTNKTCVEYVTNWWAYRLGVPRHVVTGQHFLVGCNTALFDTVAYTLAELGLNNVRGSLDKFSLDLDKMIVTLTTQLSAKSGAALATDLTYWCGPTDWSFCPPPVIIDDPFADIYEESRPEIIAEPPELTPSWVLRIAPIVEVTRTVEFMIAVTCRNRLTGAIETPQDVEDLIFEFTSTDASDVLTAGAVTLISAPLSDGKCIVDLAIIDGGEDVDEGELRAHARSSDGKRRYDVTSARDSFVINPDPTQAFTFEITPTQVTRGEPFRVKITGGPSNGLVEMQLHSTDVDDGIRRGTSGPALTLLPIQFDVDGIFDEDDLEIVGGREVDTGAFKLPQHLDWEEKTSDTFTIEGGGDYLADKSDSLTFSDAYAAYTLLLTPILPECLGTLPFTMQFNLTRRGDPQIGAVLLTMITANLTWVNVRGLSGKAVYVEANEEFTGSLAVVGALGSSVTFTASGTGFGTQTIVIDACDVAIFLSGPDWVYFFEDINLVVTFDPEEYMPTQQLIFSSQTPGFTLIPSNPLFELVEGAYHFSVRASEGPEEWGDMVIRVYDPTLNKYAEHTVELRTWVLNFEAEFTNVIRCQPFGIILTNGTPGTTVEVSLLSGDETDTLHVHGEEPPVTTLTFDVAGSWAGNLEIKTGTESTTFQLRFQGGTGNYAPLLTEEYLIAGVCAGSDEGSLVDMVSFDPDTYHCSPESATFTIGCLVPNEETEASVSTPWAATWSGRIDIATPGVTFADSSTSMEISGSSNAWEGTLSFGYVPMAVTLRLVIDELGVNKRVVAMRCPPQFTLALQPSRSARDADIQLKIYKVKSDGTRDLTYVPTAPLTISLPAKDDPADTLTVTAVPITGWASGSRTIAVRIVGGTAANAAVTFQVSDGAAYGTVVGVIAPTGALVSGWAEAVRAHAAVSNTSYRMDYVRVQNEPLRLDISMSTYTTAQNSVLASTRQAWYDYLMGTAQHTAVTQERAVFEARTTFSEWTQYRPDQFSLYVNLVLTHRHRSKTFDPGALGNGVITARIQAGNNVSARLNQTHRVVFSSTPIVTGYDFYRAPHFVLVEAGVWAEYFFDATAVIDAAINRSVGGTLYIASGLDQPLYMIPNMLGWGTPQLAWVSQNSYSERTFNYQVGSSYVDLYV